MPAGSGSALGGLGLTVGGGNAPILVAGIIDAAIVGIVTALRLGPDFAHGCGLLL